MEVDAAAPTTPQKTPTEALPRATPALRGETSEAGNRPTGPAGHSKTVRIATSSLMNSKHAGADEPPSTQTSANERGRRERNKEAKEQRASPSAQIQEEKREGKKDGWTTVERASIAGSKQSRVPGGGGGVTTFWSTPDGLMRAGGRKRTVTWGD